MPQRFPRVLLIALALVAVISFSASVYLENNDLAVLQAHPIMVNLMSGIVGFSSGLLALSFGINWFVERQWIANRLTLISGASDAMTHAAVDPSIAGAEAVIDHQAAAARISAWLSSVEAYMEASGIQDDDIIAQRMSQLRMFLSTSDETDARYLWPYLITTLNEALDRNPRVKRIRRQLDVRRAQEEKRYLLAVEDLNRHRESTGGDRSRTG